MAIMRLGDQPNYTWVATVSDDARTYEIEGRTLREGFSRVKMPLINTVRRKLGRDCADTRAEMIFQGNAECVLRINDDWLRLDELTELPVASSSEEVVSIVVQPGSVGLPPARKSQRDEEPRHFSNLQFAISPPHEELAIIVGSHLELSVDGDMVSGQLSELGARLLLVRDGQSDLTAVRASGAFKIWLRAGSVRRYQVDLDGMLAITTAKSKHVTIPVRQRTTTDLRDIGTTKVEIPEAARAKLTGR